MKYFNPQELSQAIELLPYLARMLWVSITPERICIFGQIAIRD
jgi:hypothetical protein